MLKRISIEEQRRAEESPRRGVLRDEAAGRIDRVAVAHDRVVVTGRCLPAAVIPLREAISRHFDASVSAVQWTLTSYLLLYTPLKQRSSACVFVGAFAGAMPPIIGSIAANGHLKWSALALFGIMFVWQVPHVYAIALIYRNDYARGGLKMLPARSGLAGDAGRHIVVWSLLLILTSLAPVLVGIAGAGYTLCALILGVLFAYQGVRVWAEPTVQHARSVLLASVMYLPTLLVMTVIDATARRLS